MGQHHKKSGYTRRFFMVNTAAYYYLVELASGIAQPNILLSLAQISWQRWHQLYLGPAGDNQDAPADTLYSPILFLLATRLIVDIKAQ